jgi:Helicase conserved C-terminal domain
MDNPSSFQPYNPLIVQSDYTLLPEGHRPLYEPARTAIGVFAALAKSPEHIHTYPTVAHAVATSALLQSYQRGQLGSQTFRVRHDTAAELQRLLAELGLQVSSALLLTAAS